MIKLISTIIICLMINNSQSFQKIEGCPRVESCSLKNYIKSSVFNFIFGNCWDDKSCIGEKETKCCPYSCGHKFCLEPLKPTVRPGQCPPPYGPGACINGCDSDQDCLNPNQKCCSNGCGKVCTDPVTVCPIDKSEGFCAIRNNTCNSDSECTSGHRCCPRRCGNKCIKLD